MIASDLLRQLSRPVLAGLLAFVLTLTLTPMIRTLAVRFGWIAKPVEDRWGRRVVARLGGVAIFIGFAVATLVCVPWDASTRGLLLGAGLVFALGLADDVRRMTPYAKLITQLLIGCVVVMSGIHITLRWEWLTIPLSVLWFVLVMNAFNLLDNMDGLAAGVGAIAACFCAYHAAQAGQWSVVSMDLILAGACLGFLRYNFPPAKIFMGDSGSHLIGLALGVLALMGTWRHSTQLISIVAVPVFVLAVPIVDTCFVTIQRLLNRKHPFSGGRDHLSHRLAILGLSERQTVVTLYVLGVSFGLLSLVLLGVRPLTAVAVWAITCALILVAAAYLAKVRVYEMRPASDTPSVTPGGPPSTRIQTMLMHKRRIVEVLVDFLIISSIYVIAHLLRFEGSLAFDLQQLVIKSLPIVLAVKLACLAGYGTYRRVWRYLGLSDVTALLKAVTLGSMLSSLALLWLWRFHGFSRAVIVIDWALCLLAIGGSRVVEQLLDEWIASASTPSTPVLIIGAGDLGARVLRSLRDDRKVRRAAVGFLDDDVRKFGNRIGGVPILGGRFQLASALDRDWIKEVLVAITDPPGELVRHVQHCCVPRGVAWRVVTAGVMETV